MRKGFFHIKSGLYESVFLKEFKYGKKLATDLAGITMNQIMKKPAIAIIFATFFAILYNISPYIGIPDKVIIAMLVLSPVVIVYMAYVILKYDKPSQYTFEERFYDDYDHKKVKGTSLK